MKSNRLYMLPWRILSLFTSGHTLMHNVLTVTHENNTSVTSEPFEQNVGHKRSEMEFLYYSTAAVWLCFSHSRLNHFCLEQSLHSALHAGKTNGPPWASKHCAPLLRIPPYLCSFSGWLLHPALLTNLWTAWESNQMLGPINYGVEKSDNSANWFLSLVVLPSEGTDSFTGKGDRLLLSYHTEF